MRTSIIMALRDAAQRTLPNKVRHWLIRTYFRMETYFNGSTESRFKSRLIPLPKLQPVFQPQSFSSKTVILVNNALASGGVERQIVNTLRIVGARDDRTFGLLCLRLGQDPDHDFFKPALADFPGFVRNAIESADTSRVLLGQISQARLEELRRSINWMPSDVQDEVFRLVAEFATLKPAVVHAWQDSTGIHAAYAARFVGVPRIIVSTRNVRPTNFSWYRPYMYLAHQEIALCGDIIMTNNSEAGRADYAEWLGIPESRFLVIRNGLEKVDRAPSNAVADLRAQLGIPADAPVVGSIFRFHGEKRPHLWIDAAAEIARQRPDVHFVIFGEGPMQQAARARAHHHRFGDRFHTPGTIAGASLGLSLFSVFLLTSQFEGTPNVVIEASGLGIPVVATDAGGTAETIEQAVTGYLVKSARPDAIADRVIEILASPHWSSRAAIEGPAFVHRQFGEQRMIAETLSLYDVKQV